MRDRLLKKLAHLHSEHPWHMLFIAIALTIIFTILASQLKQTMRLSALLPSKDKRTIEYNKIIKEFSSASSIVLVVQGKESQIKAFADAVAPEIKKTFDEKDGKFYVKRIDYKQEVDYIKKHGLMLIKAEYLKNLKDIFTDPNFVSVLTNINNSFEKEYVGQEESMSSREKEDRAVSFLDGIEYLLNSVKKSLLPESISKDEIKKAVDRLLVGDPYFLSYDKSTLILNIMPTFTLMETDKMVSGVDAIQIVLDRELKKFPDIKAGLTGILAIGHDEMVYSEKSLGYTSVIAIIAIFLLLALSFKMWTAPALAILNLLVGVIWAMGVAAILVGTLNIMTSMTAVILLGLGIDFSIHIISSFTENRSLGKPIKTSLEETFTKSGKGIITGGLTTFAAFFALTISSSKGMKEMGIVTSFGLIAILIVTFLFLPTLLVIRERRLEKKLKDRKSKKKIKDISFKSLGAIGKFLSNHPGATIIFSILITIFMIFSALNITFDQNYMHLEAKGLTSVSLLDTVLDKFDLSMDYALILAKNPEESNKLSKDVKDLPSVAMTEDISLYLPSESQQLKRIKHINHIKDSISAVSIRNNIKSESLDKFISELKRLEMNIVEMQDMAFLGGQDKVDRKCTEIIGKPDDPHSINHIKELIKLLEEDLSKAFNRLKKIQEVFAPYFKKSVLNMTSTKLIRIKDLPVSILDRYSNKDRTQFLVTVFPSGDIWQNAEFLDRFVKDIETIGDNATGFPLVFHALIEIVGQDGRNAMLLTIFIVFLLLLIDFRKPVHVLIAMIPLAAGVIWMVGLMKLTGMQITVINLMGLPMILGIGIDNGVHILHRWRIEGRNKIETVFSTTGKAIFLSTLTTMLAFGSLMFSLWRGFANLGSAMFIGVGACFLTTIFILSGVLGFLNKKNKNKIV